MMVFLHATGGLPELNLMSPAWEGVQVFALGELQDFSTRLFRDPDAIGVLHCHLPDFAPQIVRGMRDGNVESRLIVLLRDRGSPQYCSWVRAQSLVAGADDAQPDSIDARELVARLRALQMRTRAPDALIPIPPTGRFDPSNHKVIGADVVIHLTGKETVLLEMLASRPGVLMTKSLLMQALYGGRDEAQAKIIDVFLCKLRRKLQPICGDIDPIQTVWGQGYRFVADEVAA